MDTVLKTLMISELIKKFISTQTKKLKNLFSEENHHFLKK